MEKTPKTLQQAIQWFGKFENCRRFMIAIRWSDGKVRCPYCGEENVTYLARARLYRCYGDHARQKFSLKVGTIFEDSPITLEKWLPAVWMLVNCKNGVSSYEIHRALGVTQKTAWFMLHRIRLAVQTNSFMKLGGPGSEVEVDETFIGGKARNMHMGGTQRRRIAQAGVTGKTAIVGLLERGKEFRGAVVTGRKRRELQGAIVKHVADGSAVYTDDFMSYQKMPDQYMHKVIDHAVKYVDGRVHTNGLENFWSLLKRGLKGTYISVEPFHLFRYLDEQSFRYNNRATKEKPVNDADRFELAMSGIVGKRITFAEATGKVGTTCN